MLDEDGKPSASAPLLDDTDDPKAIPLKPLKLRKPPPTKPSYVLSPTGQAKPVIHEGMPQIPPISLPDGPVPPLTYHAPQEPNPTAGYAPDAPEGMVPPLSQSGSALNQYPPQPVSVPSSPEDSGRRASKAISTLHKQKALELLSDSSMHASLQASLTSLSAVGSPYRDGTPLSDYSEGSEKETSLYTPLAENTLRNGEMPALDLRSVDTTTEEPVLRHNGISSGKSDQNSSVRGEEVVVKLLTTAPAPAL